MGITIEAPTDAQLDVIRVMCRERDVSLPDVVASKREASEIIDALKSGTYDAGRYDWNDDGVPF